MSVCLSERALCSRKKKTKRKKEKEESEEMKMKKKRAINQSVSHNVVKKKKTMNDEHNTQLAIEKTSTEHTKCYGLCVCVYV